jgi:tyrosine-protein kinase Etk/Wzc
MSQTFDVASQEEEEQNTTSLLDIVLVLAQNKKLLFFVPLVAGVLGILISILLPNIYLAQTKVLPPQQSQSSASAMLSQLGGLAGGAGAALGIKNPNDLYVAMLRSRSISDRLIARFDLHQRYKQKWMSGTRKILENSSVISTGKDGIIVIEFEDKDPKIAAAIANAYVEELISLTGNFALTDAAKRRVFYEKQLLLAKDKMIAAETALSKGLAGKGLVSVDTQSKAVLETAARLRAGISAKEIQLKSMQAFVTSNNIEYKRARQELIGMQEELAKLEHGSAKPDDKQEIASAPQGTSEVSSIQLLRDSKYYQMLYDLLAKQYEIARLDEAKDIPMIQVLDKAIEPEHKFKPKRTMFAVSCAIAGFFLALLLIFFRHLMSLPKSPEEQEKWQKLSQLMGFKRKI